MAISLPLLTLALACSRNQLSGEVDGLTVGPASEAVFDLIPGGDSGDDRLVVVLGGALDTCRLLSILEEAAGLDCARACERYADASRLLPDLEVWWLRLTIIPSGQVTGSYEIGANAEPGAYFGYLERWDTSALDDEAACKAACKAGSALPGRFWDVIGGSLEVDDYEASRNLVGSFKLEVGQDDVVRGRFDADFCDTYVD
jgi:hypothetical protein